MIEQSIVHLPDLVKDIDWPVSIYLVYLSRRIILRTSPIGLIHSRWRYVNILELAREGTRKEDLLSRLRKVLAASLVSALMLGMVAFPAAASDHVFNAVFSQGSDDRGFANPVTGNPGDAQADPSQVPGEGNPNFGLEQGTPAVDLSLAGNP